MQRDKVYRAAAVLAVTAGGVSLWSGLAQADGAGAHGLSPVVDSNVRVDEPIRIKQKAGARVIVTHITVQPGGHTPWHYHPGPHIVSVKSGTVTVLETDCSPTEYSVGDGFFDPGSTRKPHVHTLRNLSDVPAEVVITDLRGEDDLRPTVPVDPPAAPCP